MGTHIPSWLRTVTVPLFVSRRRLCEYRNLPRAVGPWALDSGGYSELSLHGGWSITPKQYARECRRYYDEIGNLEWIASMDWMCEPWILQKTGLTVQEHQQRTVDNYRELRQLDPGLPWRPVLQGWVPDDYLRHKTLYHLNGVNLYRLPFVGLGSVCRRQHTDEIEHLIRRLQPLPLHGFGFKLKGLEKVADVIYSADSMAWSLAARYAPPTPGHTHKNCANCLGYALIWRDRVMCLLRAANARHPGQRNVQ